MKCLIVTQLNETGSVGYVTSVRMALDALGISHRRGCLNALGTLATISSTYDFIVIPQVDHASLYATNLINQANITIPIFVMSSGAGVPSTGLGSTPGVSGTVGSLLDHFVTSTWSTSTYWGYRSRHFTPSGGTGVKTVSTTTPIDGSAQANAGNYVEWYTTKTGAGGLYCSLSDLYYLNPLAEMIQTAYNNGNFTASQMATVRRAPVVFDLDHVNDPTFDTTFVADYAASTIDNFDRLINFIPSNGASWGGIGNSSDTYIDSMGATMKSRLQGQNGKKFRYCYHTHSATRGQPVTGTWPSITTVKTKTNQDSYYTTDKSKWEAQGLTFKTPAYYNNGGLAWNDETLELFSEDASMASSPGNATRQAGRGFRVFRGATNSSRKLVNAASGTAWNNVHKIKKQTRGILMIPVGGIVTGSPINTTALWLSVTKFIHAAINQGASLYMHAYDFKAPQAPLTNYAGDELMRMLNDMATRLPNTAHFFADPLDFWAGRGAGQAP